MLFLLLFLMVPAVLFTITAVTYILEKVRYTILSPFDMPKLDIRVDLGVFISMQVCIRPLIWSIVNPLFNSVLSLILCLLLN